MWGLHTTREAQNLHLLCLSYLLAKFPKITALHIAHYHFNFIFIILFYTPLTISVQKLLSIFWILIFVCILVPLGEASLDNQPQICHPILRTIHTLLYQLTLNLVQLHHYNDSLSANHMHELYGKTFTTEF